MVTVAYRRPAGAKPPTVSFVLLDWSCRESYHSLDYLAKQTVERDAYEIIWIEFYQQRAADLDKKLADYSTRGLPAPIDLWTIIGMDQGLYYHKHLMYNIGIVQSRGDIVVICDSDAMFPPNFVETVIATFRENPGSVVHFDQVRNAREDFYPFNYPSFEEVLGAGVMNWRDGKTNGLWDTTDPLHTRNYGACFCARRDDLIAIGGADEHLDYLGHVCGPYELTFRLVNKGLREIWHDNVFLYHTWHPGSDGDFNYIGPHDGRHMSTTALGARVTGRIMPLVENATIRGLREGRELDLSVLVDPNYREAWTQEAVSRSPRFQLFKRNKAAPRLIMSADQHNIVAYEGQYYAIPKDLGPVDLEQESDRSHPRIIRDESLDGVRAAIAAPPQKTPDLTPAAVAPPQRTPDRASAAVAPPQKAPDRAPAAVAPPQKTLDRAPAALKAPSGFESGAVNGVLPSHGAPPQVSHNDASPDRALIISPDLELAAGELLGARKNGISSLADFLVNSISQNQLKREMIEQRLGRIEAEHDRRDKALNQVRAATLQKDRLIAALQDRISEVEREREELDREAKHWRDHVLQFRKELDLLPLLHRKDIAMDTGAGVLVLPTSEPGHFLFGPYLPLQAGRYEFTLRYRASWVLRPKEPLLTVEIAAGQNVLAAEVLTSDSEQLARIEFTVPPEAGADDSKVEFRLSHHANASLEIRSAQLGAANLASPKRNRLSAPTISRLSQPLRLFYRPAGRA